MSKKRQITFCEALNEALYQEMKRDEKVFVYGVGVPDYKKVFSTTDKLVEKFGEERCFDTPISEDSLTGFGMGAAINGFRPVYIQIRMDFLALSFNQLVNMISCARYNTGGQISVPLVIRGLIGRGWGQGSQHSKSLHSVFCHIPGLKVVAPTTPSDAKGLLIASIRDNNPVIFVEHRWLYWQKGPVKKEIYTIPLGSANKLRSGKDLTIVGISWMNVEAFKAAEILSKKGIEIEIIDPRTLHPLNDSMIIESVNKTGYCLVADCDWIESGISSEIASRVSKKCFNSLKHPVERIGFAPCPCPTARHLEDEFYPNAEDIIRMIEKMLGIKKIDLTGEQFYSFANKFKGPF